MINSVLKHVIRLLPQNAISRTAGKWGHSSFSRHIIKPYSALYKIDKEEIEKPLEEYPTFTAFFTRKLKEDARPISSGIDTLVSPVDGKVAQFGTITEGALIQAKGINYTVERAFWDARPRSRISMKEARSSPSISARVTITVSTCLCRAS